MNTSKQVPVSNPMKQPLYVALNRTTNAGHYGDSVLQLAHEVIEGGGEIKNHDFYYCGSKLVLALVPPPIPPPIPPPPVAQPTPAPANAIYTDDSTPSIY